MHALLFRQFAHVPRIFMRDITISKQVVIVQDFMLRDVGLAPQPALRILYGRFVRRHRQSWRVSKQMRGVRVSFELLHHAI